MRLWRARKLLVRLIRALQRRAGRLADRLDASVPDPQAVEEPLGYSGAQRGGPPEHWLQLVRRHAPQLLRPEPSPDSRPEIPPAPERLPRHPGLAGAGQVASRAIPEASADTLRHRDEVPLGRPSRREPQAAADDAAGSGAGQAAMPLSVTTQGQHPARRRVLRIAVPETVDPRRIPGHSEPEGARGQQSAAVATVPARRMFARESAMTHPPAEPPSRATPFVSKRPGNVSGDVPVHVGPPVLEVANEPSPGPRREGARAPFGRTVEASPAPATVATPYPQSPAAGPFADAPQRETRVVSIQRVDIPPVDSGGRRHSVSIPVAVDPTRCAQRNWPRLPDEPDTAVSADRWPRLPDEMPSAAETVPEPSQQAALMRAAERQRRQDREQRGEIWNA